MTKWTVEALSQWVQNDEGLYNWWKRTRLPIGKFIRDNRFEIEAACNAVLQGCKPAHYLAYRG